jgi:hypothetical protein
VKEITMLQTKTSQADVGEKRERPIRVGVYSTVDGAETAVQGLLAAGFSHDEITVMCSDETRERHFKAFEHQKPAGSHTNAAVAAGSVLGAAIGGLAAVAGLITTGGLIVLATGGLAAWAGGVVGGLVGAMMTRGVERELANFYDQAITAGKILVAVDTGDPPDLPRLNDAEQILTKTGAEPIALPEG